MISICNSVVEKAAVNFSHDKEYGFADLTGIFDTKYLLGVSREISENIKTIIPEKNIYGSHKKYRLSNICEMPNSVADFITYLNSKDFLRKIEKISGIDNLIADPNLQGGGVHAIEHGGYLKLHTDFNWNETLQAHRRLNLIVYLNEDWCDSWGGSIELWDSMARNKIYSMSPAIGNVMLFATTDFSYHGHPDPLESPPGIWRKSIALYYYTQQRPNDEVIFGASSMTNYVERPGEVFENDVFRRIMHKLKLQFKKMFNSKSGA